MLTLICSLLGIGGVAGLILWAAKYAKEREEKSNAESQIKVSNSEIRKAQKVAEIVNRNDVDGNTLIDRMQGKHRD